MENFERGSRSRDNLMTRYTKNILEGNLKQAQLELSKSQLAIGEAAGSESNWHDNAAFDYANMDFDLKSVNLANLQKKLRNVEILTPRRKTDNVDIGNAVVIKFEGEPVEETYTILGPDDAGRQSGWLSYLSPLGSSLMGRKSGDFIEFSTISVETYRAKILRILSGNFE